VSVAEKKSSPISLATFSAPRALVLIPYSPSSSVSHYINMPRSRSLRTSLVSSGQHGHQSLDGAMAQGSTEASTSDRSYCKYCKKYKDYRGFTSHKTACKKRLKAAHSKKNLRLQRVRPFHVSFGHRNNDSNILSRPPSKRLLLVQPRRIRSASPDRWSTSPRSRSMSRRHTTSKCCRRRLCPRTRWTLL
jgi:hypothetical protein